MSIYSDIEFVYRDFNTPGDPGSGESEPDKARIRALLRQISGGTGAVGEFRGEWDIATAYIRTDLVGYGGSVWYADAPSTGVTPAENATWSLFIPGGSIPDGSITTAKLASEAVTEAKVDADFLADLRRVSSQGLRRSMRYYNGTSLQFQSGDGFVMGGFRFRGVQKRTRAPIFAEPTPLDGSRHIASIGNGTSTQGDLFYEATATVKTWYAVFACADDGDASAVIKITPFLRVGTKAGSVINLAAAGEADYTRPAQSYEFTVNGLVGADVLVITETLNGRATSWSGRLTTVTANTTSTVTLASIGAMDGDDRFLVAPKYDHYVYIGCGYFEDAGAGAAELRNLTDDGRMVKTRGINLGAGSGWVAGAMSSTPPWTTITPSGHIPPLATGIILRSTIALSTASLGVVGETYGMDTLHSVREIYEQKEDTANYVAVNDDIHIPFMFGPTFFMYRDGSLAASNSGALMPVGWVEP